MFRDDYHKYKAQIRMTIDKGKEIGRTFNQDYVRNLAEVLQLEKPVDAQFMRRGRGSLETKAHRK